MTTNQATANSIINLVLSATTWAGVAINATSSPITQIYCSLHSSDPGATGNQTTNEIAYTGYSRVAVSRSGGWTTATTGSSSPVSSISFPTGTGGTGTATFAALGTASNGTGSILWSGPMSPAIVCGNGVTPTLTTGSSLVVS